MKRCCVWWACERKGALTFELTCVLRTNGAEPIRVTQALLLINDFKSTNSIQNHIHHLQFKVTFTIFKSKSHPPSSILLRHCLLRIPLLKISSLAEDIGSILLFKDKIPPAMVVKERIRNSMTEEVVDELIKNPNLDQYEKSSGCRALLTVSPRGFSYFLLRL